MGTSIPATPTTTSYPLAIGCAALDALIGQDITVPVWDESTRCSSKVRYHVIGFANIRITSYQLPHKRLITAVFLGMAECGGE